MARLVFRNGPFAGKGLALSEGKTLTIGRNRDLELPLPDLRLSRRHCQIESAITGFLLRDLASTNGTFVNGQRVETEVQLRHLDVVLIGDTEIEFQMPEALEQGQTRIGPSTRMKTPVPVQVSQALEPATGTSTAAKVSPGTASPAWLPAEGAPAAASPSPELMQGPARAPAAPVGAPGAAAAMQDPLAVAIAELDLPLPPEPSVELPQRPQVAFCDQCNGSIPIMDVDLCVAKEIDGKLFCRECVARGVPGGATAGGPSTENWGKSASEKDIDDILKGLDQVEEIPVESDAARRAAQPRGPTGRQVPVSGPPKTESAFERLLNEEPASPPKAKPKAPPSKADNLLGDDFEEIR